MIELKPIGIYEIMEQQAILADHWDEVALNKQLMQLRPRWQAYFQLEIDDAVFVVGAYEGTRLIGYSLNFLHNHLHYAELRVCQNDLLFVLTEYRSQPVGLRLMKATREEAKHRGAQIMLWHAKEGTSLDRILSRRRQSKVQDIVYSEQL